MLSCNCEQSTAVSASFSFFTLGGEEGQLAIIALVPSYAHMLQLSRSFHPSEKLAFIKFSCQFVLLSLLEDL